MAMEPLIDGHGRRIGDLRVSVTDRCNFRCQYCMPAEGLPWLERDDVLRFEEIERLVALLARDGRQRRAPDRRRAARAPRLPAAGRDARARRRRRRPLADHQRLPARARRRRRSCDAGVDRFNVSIDSLQRDRFFQITRRDALPQVLRGLEALAALPRGAPDQGQRGRACAASPRTRCCRSREFAREHPYEVRFIEFMPLDADHAWTPRPGADRRGDPRDRSTRVHPLEPAAARAARHRARLPLRRRPAARSASSTRSREPFCGDCNRIRLTADGKLRTCLFSLNETDLREPLRAGAERRRARADHPRRRLAQGAQAPRQRAGLRPAAAHDERDRRLSAARASAAAEQRRRLQDVLRTVDVEERLVVGPLDDPRVQGGDDVAQRRGEVAAGERASAPAARSARTAAAGGRPRAAPPPARRAARSRASAATSARVTNGMSPATTTTGRPCAQRSACDDARQRMARLVGLEPDRDVAVERRQDRSPAWPRRRPRRATARSAASG